LWNATTGQKLRAPEESRGGTFTPDGKQVIFGSALGGLYVHETATGKQVRKLAADSLRKPDEPGGFHAAAVSRDGNLLLADADKSIYLFDLRTGKHQKRDDGADLAVVYGAAFSPDGKWVACGSKKAFRLFDTKTLNLLREWPHPYRHDASVASFTPDGKK